jgi:hypothetical protein
VRLCKASSPACPEMCYNEPGIPYKGRKLYFRKENVYVQ